jgi:methionyl-tRNA synthetase
MPISILILLLAFLCAGVKSPPQEAARNSGEDVRAFCDRVSAQFRTLFAELDIAHDDFIRTTEPRHAAAVDFMWRRLQRLGHIYLGQHEGWYCRADETFVPAAQVKQVTRADGSTATVVAESGHAVEWVAEQNYKFRLSAFREQLTALLGAHTAAAGGADADAVGAGSGSDGSVNGHASGSHTHANGSRTDASGAGSTSGSAAYPDRDSFVVPPLRAAECALQLGPSRELADLSISRARARSAWGLPVPDDAAHTIYVWLDALTNYLTAAGYPNAMDVMRQHAWPTDVHVIGKDIARFHTIYWVRGTYIHIASSLYRLLSSFACTVFDCMVLRLSQSLSIAPRPLFLSFPLASRPF